MKLNPSLQFLFLLICAVEVSFTNNLSANIIIIVIGLIIILINGRQLSRLLTILMISFIPAAGLMLSQAYYADNLDAGYLLFSRVYVYVIIGCVFIFQTRLNSLANSLEQNFHLPSKFVYGVIGAVNLLPTINLEIKKIKIASAMRGVKLHWWSPTLYFKAIVSALRWAGALASGIESHGFVEGGKRTHYEKVPMTKWDFLFLFLEIIVLQFILFLL